MCIKNSGGSNFLKRVKMITLLISQNNFGASDNFNSSLSCFLGSGAARVDYESTSLLTFLVLSGTTCPHGHGLQPLKYRSMMPDAGCECADVDDSIRHQFHP